MLVAATMRSEAYDDRPLMIKLNSDGSYDESFSADGIKRPLAHWNQQDRGAVEATEALPLGSGVLLGATVHKPSRLGHERETLLLESLASNGARDLTFAANGVYRLRSVPLPTRVVSVIDDTVLACGNSPDDTLTVVRLDTHGAPIAGFGADGVSRIANRDHVGVVDCALTPSGGVVVVQLGDGGFALTHLTSSGAPDPSFGDGGLIFRRLPRDLYAVTAEVTATGRVTILTGDGDDMPTVTKRLANGGVDPGFGGGDGFADIDLGAGAYASQVSDLALGPHGTIVASGARSKDGANSAYVARLLADGSPDPAFGAAGVSVVPGLTRYFQRIALYPDGRILARDVAGDSATATLTRLLG